jgi:hypothetical protein
LDFRLGLHAIPEVSAQELGRVQVHFSAHDFGKLPLHGEECQARHMAGLELDKNIHIAVGTEIVSQDGAEEGQPSDVVSPAEIGDLFSIKRDARHVSLLNRFQPALQRQIRR